MSEVFLNIRRTPFQSASMFLIQLFSAFLLLMSISTTIFLVAIFNKVETQVPVIVYFKPTTKEADILKLREQLQKSENVQSIDYIDKDSAYEFYKRQNKDNPLLLEMTTAENFPISFEILSKNSKGLFEIANFFKNESGVDEVQFDKLSVERLVMITNVLRISVFVLAAYLAFMSIITLVTMVMFKIALRKDEIELQELLGATKSRIAMPFFDEGNVITILSTLTSAGIFVGIIYAIRDSLETYLYGTKSLIVTFYQYNFVVWPINILSVSILVGVIFIYLFLMNILATKIATDKYIR